MARLGNLARSVILENASSLLEEAVILFEKEKIARASALAILSIEESGKCKLIDHALKDGQNVESSNRSHVKKQRMIASYEQAESIYSMIKEFLEERDLEIKHVSELSDTQKEFFGSVAHKELDKIFQEHVKEEGARYLEELYRTSKFHRGEYNRIKNASLYVDVDSAGELISSPFDISKEDAIEIIEQAKAALEIARRDE